jgi:pyruvate,water dikinase
MDRQGGKAPVLTDEEVLRLARLVLRVHWALGQGQEPQDVEWASDGGQFWLVQARPVTRLPRPTFPAVAHLPVIWSNANLKDIVPGAHRTLGWNLISNTVRNIAWASLEAVNYGVPPGMESTRRIAGRAYFDLSAIQWAFHDAFGMSPAETTRDLGGHQPEIPVPAGSPFRGLRGLARLGNRLRLLGRLLPLPWRLPRAIARLQAVVRAVKAEDWTRLSQAALLERVYRLRDELLAYSDTYQFAIVNSSVWVGLLESVLRRATPVRAQSLIAGLMAGSGQMTSAEQGRRLFDLADVARGDRAAQAYLEQTPRDPHGWKQLPEGSPFRAALARYLEEFGHRGVYELVLENPRWNEDPSYLLEQVRLLLAAGPGREARQAAAAARQKAEQGLAQVSWSARPLVRLLARRARQAVVLREEGKSALVALMEPTRYLFLEAGRRLAASGILAEPTDLFHLSWTDVECYLRGEWDGTAARTLVDDRKALFAQWLTETPPDVVILDAAGQPAALPAAAAGPPAKSDGRAARGQDGRRLVGVGVAGGRASGRARLVRHPAEGSRLGPGEVLVAPSTDPGWTPLFLRAAAIIMEVGGYLSHGAIVAREYGIPAVVNIPGLLQAVQDGQQVTIDGDEGIVLLEERR